MGWNDNDIAVLDGGLLTFADLHPEYIDTSRQEINYTESRSDIPVQPNTNLLCTIDQIKENLKSSSRIVIDARPAGRFNGTSPEPRPSLPSGHMPNSVNIPFSEFVLAKCLKSPEDIINIFKSHGIDVSQDKPDLIFSCGSGVSAAVAELALHSLGGK